MKVGDLVIVPDNLVRPALVLDIIEDSTGFYRRALFQRKHGLRDGATQSSGAWGEALIMFQRTGYKMWVDIDKLKVIS